MHSANCFSKSNVIKIENTIYLQYPIYLFMTVRWMNNFDEKMEYWIILKYNWMQNYDFYTKKFTFLNAVIPF